MVESIYRVDEMEKGRGDYVEVLRCSFSLCVVNPFEL